MLFRFDTCLTRECITISWHTWYFLCIMPLSDDGSFEIYDKFIAYQSCISIFFFAILSFCIWLFFRNRCSLCHRSSVFVIGARNGSLRVINFEIIIQGAPPQKKPRETLKWEKRVITWNHMFYKFNSVKYNVKTDIWVHISWSLGSYESLRTHCAPHVFTKTCEMPYVKSLTDFC